ncbi:hypothetical protein B0H19DRAFT_1370598 [Mycena capillaripes]|nr:hypothetical protein B0H19DRAFT_1370598 [Mycena capillaripes]
MVLAVEYNSEEEDDLWRCNRPHNTTRADYHATIEGIQAFYQDQSQASNIGRLKKHLLAAKGALESDLFPKFSVYFEDLKPCLAELRNAFKNTNKFTYVAMLDILRRTRDALPLVEDWSPQNDPAGYNSRRGAEMRRADQGQ